MESEMTQKNRTLEGKNRTLGGMGVKNRRTSFMNDSLDDHPGARRSLNKNSKLDFLEETDHKSYL